MANNDPQCKDLGSQAWGQSPLNSNENSKPDRFSVLDAPYLRSTMYLCDKEVLDVL